jgi:alpha-L-arabinofuranosidase
MKKRIERLNAKLKPIPMKSIFLLLLFLTSATTIYAQSEQPQGKVHVRLDLENPLNTISKYLTGSHFVYGSEPDELYKDERIAQWMKDSKVGTIRYPGGTVVMSYHWDSLNGINFNVDSWDPDYNETARDPANFMDVDEYIAYCKKVNTEPMVGVNILSGRKYNREKEGLDEARRLIQHCVDKNYQVKFWYIGNEAYAKGFSPLEYAEYIDKFAETLKSVDPNIGIIGDWKLGPLFKNRFNQSIEIVKNSKHIDVMEVHEKWGNEWGLASGHNIDDWKKEFPLYDGKLGMYIQRFKSEMERIGKPNVKFGCNEWGLGNIPNSTKNENALLVADYLIELFRNDVYMANYWNLNMGGSQNKVLNTSNNQLQELNPIADIFKMFASAMGKNLIRVDCTNKEVYGFATLDKKAKKVQLYLMNKSEEVSEIEMSGFPGAYKKLDKENFDINGNHTKNDNIADIKQVSLEPWSISKMVFSF